MRHAPLSTRHQEIRATLASLCSLEERIKALHEELDVVIAKYVDERAAQVPGVHRSSVEGSKM